MKSLDLTKLFGSKTRTKLLEKFFLEYDAGNNEGFHMRALSRDLEEQINSIKRELDSLEELHILKSREEAKKKIFFVNKNFILIEEFKSIFLKTYNPYDNIKKFFKEEENLDLVIINEELSKRLIGNTKNIVDIFMIGEIDKIKFNDFLEKTFFNRKIKYAIITLQDFQKRLEYNDKLIFNIVKQRGNLFLKDEIGVKELIKHQN
ncbi:MAG: hypothetical protein NWP80_00285 [Candidatus Gracilibacteria bacterium]|nr:hypothetical protein [Candidatus Gracilibacteria bacterium]